MKKVTSTLFLCLLCVLTGVAQQTYKGKTISNGKIRIKFKNDPVVVQRLQAATLSSPNAHVRTGIASYDQLNARYQARHMQRVFRPAGTFEASHQKWGLHLWYEMELDNMTDVGQVMQAYTALAEVEVAEPVFKKSLDRPKGAPNDPSFTSQTGHYNLINLTQAHDLERGNQAVVVAVEDMGIQVNHPDLAGNIWKNPGEIPNNRIDDDNNGYVDDYNGYDFANNRGSITGGDHGTHVGGTIGAETNNGIGVAGVAGGSGNDDGVRLMSLAVFDAIDPDNIQAGFEEAFVYAADNGAVISQNSWGGGIQSDVLEDAIDYFIAKAGGAGKPMQGGLVVFAAGNSDTDDILTGYPASYAPVLAVASLDYPAANKSYFSNYGFWIDISAPGSGVYSTYPGNSYGYFSGTSMACPHVSGVAALVVSKRFREGKITTAETLTNIVKNTANANLLFTANVAYSGLLGSGVLDAYSAVTETFQPNVKRYCGSAAISPYEEWISQVKIGDLTHTSEARQYNDFTNKVARIPAGSSPVTIKIDYLDGTVYPENVRIWIDLDKDTTFSANELVFQADSVTLAQGYVTLPVSAIGTTTRMRVSMRTAVSDRPAPEPCEIIDIGEVEDYTVTIVQGSTSCDVPQGAVATAVTATKATLRWQPVGAATSYKVRYRMAGAANWVNKTTATTSLDVTGLSQVTNYEFQVSSVCASGSSAYSPSATFATPSSLNYCTAWSLVTRFEYIDFVGLANLTNTSSYVDNLGYVDYTTKIATITSGKSYPLSCSAGFGNGTAAAKWKIFIDYNQDGDFADAGETVVQRTVTTAAIVKNTITVPATAKTGITRMRVVLSSASATPQACGKLIYGEVEDYSVRIQPASAARSDNDLLAGALEPLRVYPNPASTQLHIETATVGKNAQVVLYNLTGQKVYLSQLSATQTILPIHQLPKGIYLLTVYDGEQTWKQKIVKE